jgi:hypothetical protein
MSAGSTLGCRQIKSLQQSSTMESPKTSSSVSSVMRFAGCVAILDLTVQRTWARILVHSYLSRVLSSEPCPGRVMKLLYQRCTLTPAAHCGVNIKNRYGECFSHKSFGKLVVSVRAVFILLQYMPCWYKDLPWLTHHEEVCFLHLEVWDMHC